jgi:hypothetical protein
LFQGHCQGKIWGIKFLIMKPQTTLRISLATTLVLAFLLSPLTSNETRTKDRRTFSIHTLVNAESSTDHSIKIDLTVPASNKKEKEKDKEQGGNDLFRNKRHADEDKHEHHHHHFDKVKHKRKIINVVSAWILKIFIALSYFSILLCSYMSIVHH